MEKKNDLCERLLQFAVDVILYLRTVKNTVETMDTKRQLIKASTSSGANLFFFSWGFGLGVWGLELFSHKNLFT